MLECQVYARGPGFGDKVMLRDQVYARVPGLC